MQMNSIFCDFALLFSFFKCFRISKPATVHNQKSNSLFCLLNVSTLKIDFRSKYGSEGVEIIIIEYQRYLLTKTSHTTLTTLPPLHCWNIADTA